MVEDFPIGSRICAYCHKPVEVEKAWIKRRKAYAVQKGNSKKFYMQQEIDYYHFECYSKPKRPWERA